MRSRPRFVSDLAQVANGAASALGGVRAEVENIVSSRTERALNARGLVTREEFDALRTRHEALAARLATIEAELAAIAPQAPPKTAPKSAPKTSKSKKPRATSK